MTLAPYVRKGRKYAAVFSGSLAEPVSAGLTASTTHTIAGGTPMVIGVNTFSTVANAGDAGTLPAMAPGEHCDVYNNGAHILAVYPASSAGIIDGGSAGASGNLTNADRARYTQVDSVNVTSAVLGATAS